MFTQSRSSVQKEIIQSIRDSITINGRALIQAATGVGKSYIARMVMTSMQANGVSCIFIAPDVAIIRDCLEDFNGECAVFSGSIEKQDLKPITFATRDSVTPEIINSFDYIQVDEAHSFSEEFFNSITSKVIAYSATPWKEDTGYIYGEGKFFKNLTYSYTASDAIRDGLICDYFIEGENSIDADVSELDRFVSDSDLTIKQCRYMISKMNKHDRKKAVILCCNIDHAEMVNDILCNEFYEHSGVVHSKVKKVETVVNEFKHGETKFLVSVSMIAQGFDAPMVDTVIYLRPIASIKMMLQSAGRGLRLSDGKTNCMMLDFAGVFTNCGTPKKPYMGNIEIASMQLLKRDEKTYLKEVIESDAAITKKELFEKLTQYASRKSESISVKLISVNKSIDKNGKRTLKLMCKTSVEKHIYIWVHSVYNAKFYHALKNFRSYLDHKKLRVKKENNFYKIIYIE